MKLKKLMMSLCLMVSMMFVLTGCVKFNADMDIKADKSMDFSIIYAIDSSMMGDNELIDAEGKKLLEEQGFKLEDYKDDKMKGFKITKNFKNIDEVSGDGDTEYSLSGVISKDNKDAKIFKVSKGFFKNTYKAKFKFSTGDSSLSGNTTTEDNSNATTSDDNSFDATSDNNVDLSNYYSNLDLKFNLTLPTDARNHNASKNENNRKLSWDLASKGTSYVEFEFDLINMTNIYICVGVGILVLAIIGAVIYLVVNKNKKGNNETVEKVDIEA